MLFNFFHTQFSFKSFKREFKALKLSSSVNLFINFKNKIKKANIIK